MKRMNRLVGWAAILVAAIGLSVATGCITSSGGLATFTLDLARHRLAAWVL